MSCEIIILLAVQKPRYRCIRQKAMLRGLPGNSESGVRQIPSRTKAGQTRPVQNLASFLWAIVAIDSAALHNERNFLQHTYVRERVAGNGNDVGEIAGLESADLILPAE